MHIGLVLTTMDGKLIEVNDAYTAIISRTQKETLSLGYWDITPLEYNDMEKEQLKGLAEKGSYGPYEKEYIHTISGISSGGC